LIFIRVSHEFRAIIFKASWCFRQRLRHRKYVFNLAQL
jgi:hypothetical protein